MQKWFSNKYFDLSLDVSENQVDWIRLDKYTLLLGLSTDNPFDFVQQNGNSFDFNVNNEELLGGALEESPISSSAPQYSPMLSKSEKLDKNTALKDAIGLRSEASSPGHIGSILGNYDSSPSIGGSSLLNILNKTMTVSDLEQQLSQQTSKKSPNGSENQDVLNMLTNMGINAREKSPTFNESSPLRSNSSSPIQQTEFRGRHSSIEVNVASPKNWSQLPEHKIDDFSDIELQQQLEGPLPTRNDWKGWAKVNQPSPTSITAIEAEQIRKVKPTVSHGWASVVGQSSQIRKVVKPPAPVVSQVAVPVSRKPQFSANNNPTPIKKQPSITAIVESSKRSADFIKWCKSECKKFGVPEHAINVITELAEKQLVVDSLLAMNVNPIDADEFGDEFIRRINMDDEMVVVKRRKRRN
eukprot:NODE_4_length_77007_cov_1.156642.p20 type:complete len:412 gc:universal NODE_4_length_77007_cov_1.156642:18609-17374(-)